MFDLCVITRELRFLFKFRLNLSCCPHFVAVFNQSINKNPFHIHFDRSVHFLSGHNELSIIKLLQSVLEISNI